MSHADLLAEDPPPTFQPDILRAPWTGEQVHYLMVRQLDTKRHSYTCGTKEKHAPGADEVLKPTLAGWKCPSCDYTQDWCHRMDTLPSMQQVDEFVQRNKIVLTDEEKAVIDKLLD